MKRILLILFLTLVSISANELSLINGKQEILKLESIKKENIVSFKIFEPYKKEFITFQGITIKDFAEIYGKKVNKLLLTALDDYTIEFTKEQIQNKNIILVFKEKNKLLSPDIKGPARIIYRNYKKDKNAIYLTKWIWMIIEAEFK